VVDVDTAGVALDELDRRPGVGVGQRAADHDAVPGAGLERLAGEVAGEDVVAGVAAVVVGVDPARAEPVAVVAGLRRSALDRQGAQHAERALRGVRRGTGGGVGRVDDRRRRLAAGGAEQDDGGQDRRAERASAVFHVEPHRLLTLGATSGAYG
jgi:hypothetical protein